METIFKLTLDDFESCLGRKLTDDEKTLVLSKFSIDNWSDEIECFADYHFKEVKK